MRIENIRLSEEAKGRLSRLKRRTGIQQWNTLCRWALCASLAEKAPPRNINTSADSNIDMTWKTFTGDIHGDVLIALLQVRCLADGLPTDDATLVQQFKLHLHRGIGYLSAPGKVQNLCDLLSLAVEGNEK